MGDHEEKEDPLATPEYWNKRYESSDGQNATHEWFRSYGSLVPFFEKRLFGAYPAQSNPRILHLGSGDSTIPYDLASQGYHNQLCLDFSTNVIEVMSKRPSQGDGVKWQWADLRNMPDVPDSSFHVAFDKGTMDAMIHGSPWDPPEVVRKNTSLYLKEVGRTLVALPRPTLIGAHQVFRVLKDDGIFLYVTFRQPHFIRPLLNSQGIWNVEMEELSDGGSSFDYYGWILTKNTQTTA